MVTLLLVSFITFSVFQILPGNPAYIILGVDADPMQIEALNKSMGLDKPALVRYVDWIAGLFRGDLGVSYRYQQPVAQLISDALEVTGSLAIITLILTLIIGVLAGVWLADHSDKWYSLPLSMLSQVSISIPSFCMAIFLISIFTVGLKWFPSIGFVSFSESPSGWLKSLILPSCSLALGTSAIVIRYVKVSVNGQRKQDYVRTAYSKGLGKNKVMYRHVLRNSLIPVITIFGMTAADIVNTYDEERLANILYLYGELKNSRKLASVIVKARSGQNIRTIGEFLEIIKPLFGREREKKELAKVFQALRIEVNQEMEALKEMLQAATEALKPGGRLVVITYHSLEDRMVKNIMKTGNVEGKAESDFFGNLQTPFRLVNNKVIVPDEAEIERNPRSRSAKLRIAEKK